jgi:hypothetical protein
MAPSRILGIPICNRTSEKRISPKFPESKATTEPRFVPKSLGMVELVLWKIRDRYQRVAANSRVGVKLREIWSVASAVQLSFVIGYQWDGRISAGLF